MLACHDINAQRLDRATSTNRRDKTLRPWQTHALSLYDIRPTVPLHRAQPCRSNHVGQCLTTPSSPKSPRPQSPRNMPRISSKPVEQHSLLLACTCCTPLLKTLSKPSPHAHTLTPTAPRPVQAANQSHLPAPQPHCADCRRPRHLASSAGRDFQSRCLAMASDKCGLWMRNFPFLSAAPPNRRPLWRFCARMVRPTLNATLSIKSTHTAGLFLQARSWILE